jgi:putative Holliday junction resolvase
MGIILGFDFGMKRIGIAVGQTVTQTARALITIQAKQGTPDWATLDKLINNWQPDALVVGIPLNMDGSEQLLTQAAQQFANTLHERFKIPVYGIDERLSTKDARERLFTEGGYKALQHGQVDSMAAQLILQNWLSNQAQEEK